MLLESQRHSPVGLLDQGLMRNTLMMRHNRNVITEMSPNKLLVQVGKENVCNRMINIVKTELHYTPQTQIVTLVRTVSAKKSL